LGSGSSSANVTGGTDEIAKSIMGIDIDLEKYFEGVIFKIFKYLNYIFEPVQHSFTNDVMSNHVQNLSLIMFILTVLIVIFFISLLFNLTLYLFSDKLLSYFTNKYII
jgi:hypothetical protein